MWKEWLSQRPSKYFPPKLQLLVMSIQNNERKMLKHFISFIPWSIKDICSVNEPETESMAQNIGSCLLNDYFFPL